MILLVILASILGPTPTLQTTNVVEIVEMVKMAETTPVGTITRL
jgi:hypothetical protein